MPCSCLSLCLFIGIKNKHVQITIKTTTTISIELFKNEIQFHNIPLITQKRTLSYTNTANILIEREQEFKKSKQESFFLLTGYSFIFFAYKQRKKKQCCYAVKKKTAKRWTDCQLCLVAYKFYNSLYSETIRCFSIDHRRRYNHT